MDLPLVSGRHQAGWDRCSQRPCRRHSEREHQPGRGRGICPLPTPWLGLSSIGCRYTLPRDSSDASTGLHRISTACRGPLLVHGCDVPAARWPGVFMAKALRIHCFFGAVLASPIVMWYWRRFLADAEHDQGTMKMKLTPYISCFGTLQYSGPHLCHPVDLLSNPIRDGHGPGALVSLKYAMEPKMTPSSSRHAAQLRHALRLEKKTPRLPQIERGYQVRLTCGYNLEAIPAEISITSPHVQPKVVLAMMDFQGMADIAIATQHPGGHIRLFYRSLLVDVSLFSRIGPYLGISVSPRAV